MIMHFLSFWSWNIVCLRRETFALLSERQIRVLQVTEEKLSKCQSDSAGGRPSITRSFVYFAVCVRSSLFEMSFNRVVSISKLHFNHNSAVKPGGVLLKIFSIWEGDGLMCVIQSGQKKIRKISSLSLMLFLKWSSTTCNQSSYDLMSPSVSSCPGGAWAGKKKPLRWCEGKRQSAKLFAAFICRAASKLSASLKWQNTTRSLQSKLDH